MSLTKLLKMYVVEISIEQVMATKTIGVLIYIKSSCENEFK
jgi:hypothetical protein